MTDTIKPHTGCQYFGCHNNATKIIRDSAGRRSFRCERHAKPTMRAGVTRRKA